ncbi:unnamed protein product [Ilex paraguariensis]|uniref:Uncharacterized protein n=1 Tax=Ilex paraguariensis TaxID=185542 RepID=A0ABC8R6F1_9AQUA
MRDVSSNSLSGYIPPSLGELNKLSAFNVSTNFLVGPIPSDGVLAKFSKDAFVGNRGLCGKQVNLACKDDVGGPTTYSQPPNSAPINGCGPVEKLTVGTKENTIVIVHKVRCSYDCVDNYFHVPVMCAVRIHVWFVQYEGVSGCEGLDHQNPSFLA